MKETASGLSLSFWGAAREMIFWLQAELAKEKILSSRAVFCTPKQVPEAK
jgi:hypothetical protein